jgi:hypothetical protein
MDRLLPMVEVGDRFGFSADWARRKAHAGCFGPVVKVGSDPQRARVLVSESGVEAYAARQAVRREVRRQIRRVTDDVRQALEQIRRERIDRERGRQPKAS